MDKLQLHQLKFETYIGIYDWEQTTSQIVIVDLDLAIDTQAIAREDNIAQAIDYTEIESSLREFLAKRHTHLLETLTQKIADFIREQFTARHFTLKVTKPSALNNHGNVSVYIEQSSAE